MKLHRTFLAFIDANWRSVHVALMACTIPAVPKIRRCDLKYPLNAIRRGILTKMQK